MSSLPRLCFVEQGCNLGHQLRGKRSALQRHNLDHIAAVTGPAPRQRDAAMFSRSIDGEKKHDARSLIRENPWRLWTSAYGFHQLEQHASRARRMYEDIAMPARAHLDFVRYQPHTVFLQPLDRRRQVGHLQRDMVKSLTSLGDETGR